MATILLTTGVPGSGKTYVRCACFLVDYFLLNSDGVHWSNFPVRPDAVAEEVVRRANFGRKGILKRITAPFRRKSRRMVYEDVLSRIQVIPQEELTKWRNEESGPWEFFNGVDLTEAHIAIDEVHNFVGYDKSPRYISKWNDFLAEVRHRGCTFEGLTQDFDQVHPSLKGRAAIQIELIPCEDMRDPFFGIKMMDWYELKAGFTGEFHKTVVEVESRKSKDSFKENRRTRFLITPDYFKFYDSFNKSLQEIAAEKTLLDERLSSFGEEHKAGLESGLKRLADRKALWLSSGRPDSSRHVAALDFAVGKFRAGFDAKGKRLLESLHKGEAVLAAEGKEAEFVASAEVKKSDRCPKYEFQRRSRLSLFVWFLLKNFWTLFARFFIAALVFWLCFGGGLNTLITHFLGATKAIAHANGVKDQTAAKGQGGAVPSPSPGSSAPGSAVPPGGPGETVPKDSFVSLQKELDASNVERLALKVELEKLKAERLSGFRPVFFGLDEAVLRNGMRIKTGFTFEKGCDYEGLTVRFIYPRERSYGLSDGRIVRMWTGP